MDTALLGKPKISRDYSHRTQESLGLPGGNTRSNNMHIIQFTPSSNSSITGLQRFAYQGFYAFFRLRRKRYGDKKRCQKS